VAFAIIWRSAPLRGDLARVQSRIIRPATRMLVVMDLLTKEIMSIDVDGWCTGDGVLGQRRG